ncbi:MAG: hypothetical protein MJ252_19340 [archaeon]|nr:hypothetical protein [archaeon]
MERKHRADLFVMTQIDYSSAQVKAMRAHKKTFKRRSNSTGPPKKRPPFKP